jgi:hypothetical protein
MRTSILAHEFEDNLMSFLLTETREGNIIEVTISDRLTKEAYQAIVPRTEAAIKKYGKIRVLFVMLGFRGWDVGALWEDIKFDWKHFNHIERLAIVGETKWERGMGIFCRPFTTATVKYFELGELETAREWVRERS